MGDRRFWSVVLLSVIAVVVLNALAGTAQSPVERMLHISRVPTWLPLVFAGVFGIVLGAIFQKRQPGGPAGTAASPSARRPKKDAGKPATRGRYAVPRHVRRERERMERRQAAQRDREERDERAREEQAKQDEERRARERAETESAARPARRGWRGLGRPAPQSSPAAPPPPPADEAGPPPEQPQA